jgi:Ulp1 family protease
MEIDAVDLRFFRDKKYCFTCGWQRKHHVKGHYNNTCQRETCAKCYQHRKYHDFGRMGPSCRVPANLIHKDSLYLNWYEQPVPTQIEIPMPTEPFEQIPKQTEPLEQQITTQNVIPTLEQPTQSEPKLDRKSSDNGFESTRKRAQTPTESSSKPDVKRNNSKPNRERSKNKTNRKHRNNSNNNSNNNNNNKPNLSLKQAIVSVAILDVKTESPSAHHEEAVTLDNEEEILEVYEARSESVVETAAIITTVTAPPHHNVSLPCLRQLTDAESKRVDKCFREGPDAVICKVGKIPIYGKDIQTLKKGKWLNDEVIGGYLTLLNHRDAIRVKETNQRPRLCLDIYFMTSMLQVRHENEGKYLYQPVMKRRKRYPNNDIFAMDKLIIPINITNYHWACVSVSIPQRTITYHDSSPGDGMKYLESIQRYVFDEYKQTHKQDYPKKNEWILVPGSSKTSPKQDNGFDCGIFTCANADCLMRGQDLDYTKHQLTGFRKHIVLALICNIAPDWKSTFPSG